jgi:hypothetical protein
MLSDLGSFRKENVEPPGKNLFYYVSKWLLLSCCPSFFFNYWVYINLSLKVLCVTLKPLSYFFYCCDSSVSLFLTHACCWQQFYDYVIMTATTKILKTHITTRVNTLPLFYERVFKQLFYFLAFKKTAVSFYSTLVLMMISNGNDDDSDRAVIVDHFNCNKCDVLICVDHFMCTYMCVVSWMCKCAEHFVCTCMLMCVDHFKCTCVMCWYMCWSFCVYVHVWWVDMCWSFYMLMCVIRWKVKAVQLHVWNVQWFTV